MTSHLRRPGLSCPRYLYCTASPRDPKQQEVLAELARSELIHFVVSTDHINANLLWDEVLSFPLFPTMLTLAIQKRRAAFKWLAMHIPTFRCYKRELLAGESRLLGLDSKQSGRAHTVDTLQAVWHSMPVNSRRLLRKLVEMICEGAFESTHVVMREECSPFLSTVFVRFQAPSGSRSHLS